jgi:amino acid adenylation domain-containing protein/thioester reductase-like protein
MVADVTETFYFKPESGGLLISPADTTPVPPGDARPDDLDVAVALDRVQACTTLTIRHVRSAWAGLRTSVPDDLPVIGEAPGTPGFFWAAALGGCGIQMAPAAGRLAAELATGACDHDRYLALGIDVSELVPGRCFSGGQLYDPGSNAEVRAEARQAGWVAAQGDDTSGDVSGVRSDKPRDRATSPPQAGQAPSRPDSLAGHTVDYGGFRPVAQLIEEQADRHPERIAASYRDSSLTYRELDGLANGLAATAAGRGVAKGDRVAVLLASSLELPVTHVAMMKLGAVFVPLDPAWPGDRLRTTLRVLSPALILCSATGQVPPEYRGDCTVVACGDIRPTAQRPAVRLGPDDLIYGFFTSGTTGVPKCALNRQAGLANRLRFMTRYFGATGDEIVLQNSKPTVDSSLWQMFWPLTTGGRTVLPVQGDFLNLHSTVDAIAGHDVTCTDFVSSIFSALVDLVHTDEAARRKLASLRHIIVGGEEMNARAVRRFRATFSNVRVINGYGPTEASIGMVFHQVCDADGDVIPLGRPIDNCFVLVAGEDGSVLPRGVVGEIVIGGACVGAGYHADPAATARAFVRNEVPGRIPGDRLYASGDLGYLDDRGRLFFAGRKDDQVKVGGVRIELAEVELAARKCPGVRQAKALAALRGDRTSLALFAVADAGLTDSELRRHLRQLLPRNSMPRHCVVLPQLPLSEGGKVDAQALRALLDHRLDVAQRASADGGGRHAQVAELHHAVVPAGLPGVVLRAFRSALGEAAFNADADFVDAGGDSLQALQAVRDLAQACQVDLSVQDLVDHPTARRLAAAIEDRRAGGSAAQAETALMERDAVVIEGELIRAPDPAAPLRTVLVTGATGFVGSRLAYELLVRTDLRLCCLSRAGDDDAARRRVVTALAERGMWDTAFEDRVDGFAGDLGQPGLGLSAGNWRHLAQTCDLILHNGALVNFLYGYRAHRPANVTGTAAILRLAMDSRPVPLHYVSTLAAVQQEAAGRPGKLGEDVDPVQVRLPRTGYGRSKLVAERYLAAARQRGAVVTVLRLGEVLPSQERTHPNHRAVTHLLLSAIHQLGTFPDVSIRSDYTPVDYAAARVVAAVTDRAAWGSTLHVFRPGSGCFAEMLALAGAPVRRVSCADFLAQLHAAAGPGAPDLSRLAALLPGPDFGDEVAARQALAGLLSDNPAQFRKDACRVLEQRWQLADGDLPAAVRAYLAYLNRRDAVSAAYQRIGRA